MNKNNNRSKRNDGRSRRRYYPRHNVLRGQPFLARVNAIKHVPDDKQSSSYNWDPSDELRVGDMVIFGDRECIPIYVGGEKYYIAYRNKLVKIKG